MSKTMSLPRLPSAGEGGGAGPPALWAKPSPQKIAELNASAGHLKPATRLVKKGGWASRAAARARSKEKMENKYNRTRVVNEQFFDPAVEMTTDEREYVDRRVVHYEDFLARDVPSVAKERAERERIENTLGNPNELIRRAAQEAAKEAIMNEPEPDAQDLEKKPWETQEAAMGVDAWLQRCHSYQNYDVAVNSLVEELFKHEAFTRKAEARGLVCRDRSDLERTGGSMSQDMRFTKWMRMRGRFIRRQVSEKEVKHLREIFNVLDMDKNGDIDLTEIQQALGALGIHMADQEMLWLMSKVNDFKGTLDFGQFVQSFETGAKEWDKLRQINNNRRKNNHNYEPALPFDLWIPAFHRGKMIEQRIGEFPTHVRGIHEEELEEEKKKRAREAKKLALEQKIYAGALSAAASGSFGSGPRLEELWKAIGAQLANKNKLKTRARIKAALGDTKGDPPNKRHPTATPAMANLDVGKMRSLARKATEPTAAPAL